MENMTDRERCLNQLTESHVYTETEVDSAEGLVRVIDTYTFCNHLGLSDEELVAMARELLHDNHPGSVPDGNFGAVPVRVVQDTLPHEMELFPDADNNPGSCSRCDRLVLLKRSQQKANTYKYNTLQEECPTSTSSEKYQAEIKEPCGDVLQCKDNVETASSFSNVCLQKYEYVEPNNDSLNNYGNKESGIAKINLNIPPKDQECQNNTEQNLVLYTGLNYGWNYANLPRTESDNNPNMSYNDTFSTSVTITDHDGSRKGQPRSCDCTGEGSIVQVTEHYKRTKTMTILENIYRGIEKDAHNYFNTKYMPSTLENMENIRSERNVWPTSSASLSNFMEAVNLNKINSISITDNKERHYYENIATTSYNVNRYCDLKSKMVGSVKAEEFSKVETIRSFSLNEKTHYLDSECVDFDFKNTFADAVKAEEISNVVTSTSYSTNDTQGICDGDAINFEIRESSSNKKECSCNNANIGYYRDHMFMDNNQINTDSKVNISKDYYEIQNYETLQSDTDNVVVDIEAYDNAVIQNTKSFHVTRSFVSEKRSMTHVYDDERDEDVEGSINHVVGHQKRHFDDGVVNQTSFKKPKHNLTKVVNEGNEFSIKCSIPLLKQEIEILKISDFGKSSVEQINSSQEHLRKAVPGEEDYSL